MKKKNIFIFSFLFKITLHPEIQKLITGLDLLHDFEEKLHRAGKIRELCDHLSEGEDFLYFAKQMFLLRRHKSLENQSVLHMELCELYEKSKKIDIWHEHEIDEILENLDILKNFGSTFVEEAGRDIYRVFERKLQKRNGGVSYQFRRIILIFVKRVQIYSNELPEMNELLTLCEDFIKKTDYVKKRELFFIKNGYHKNICFKNYKK